MHNFFRTVDTDAGADRALVLQRIANAKMLIGVVGEPEFLEEEGHFEQIWRTAERLDALVFSGDAMLNGRGELLLRAPIRE
jgi:hypothetical protein